MFRSAWKAGTKSIKNTFFVENNRKSATKYLLRRRSFSDIVVYTNNESGAARDQQIDLLPPASQEYQFIAFASVESRSLRR